MTDGLADAEAGSRNRGPSSPPHRLLLVSHSAGSATVAPAAFQFRSAARDRRAVERLERTTKAVGGGAPRTKRPPRSFRPGIIRPTKSLTIRAKLTNSDRVRRIGALVELVHQTVLLSRSVRTPAPLSPARGVGYGVKPTPLPPATPPQRYRATPQRRDARQRGQASVAQPAVTNNQ